MEPVTFASRPALVALRDCGVLRSRFARPDLDSLVNIGLATASTVATDPCAIDYRLTALGWNVTERLRP